PLQPARPAGRRRGPLRRPADGALSLSTDARGAAPAADALLLSSRAAPVDHRQSASLAARGGAARRLAAVPPGRRAYAGAAGGDGAAVPWGRRAVLCWNGGVSRAVLRPA